MKNFQIKKIQWQLILKNFETHKIWYYKKKKNKQIKSQDKNKMKKFKNPSLQKK